MKAYYLVSPYLSDIQKGIQVSHCTCEMTVKVLVNSNIKDTDFFNWATKHKTMIVLSYGTYRGIIDIIWNHLEKTDTRFYGKFEERELNNLPTVGFILTEKDVRKIGQLRQERRFIISKGLRKAESFSYHLQKGMDEVSKRDWFEALCSEENPQINDSDFLRIISTFHMA